MKRRIAVAISVLAVGFILAQVVGLVRPKTHTTLGLEQTERLFALKTHPEVPATPEMTVERFSVIAASPDRIYELLAAVDRWHTWDPAITRASAAAARPLEVGDRFSKEESGIAIDARVLDAEPGRLLRWRGLAPGRIVGIHSFRLVPLEEGRTLVVNREEYSSGYLRWIGWATDLGIGAQFERTLGALRSAAESDAVATR